MHSSLSGATALDSACSRVSSKVEAGRSVSFLAVRNHRSPSGFSGSVGLLRNSLVVIPCCEAGDEVDGG